MRTPTILLGLLLSTALSAQNLGEIRGKVSDPSGQPVPFAHVTTTVSGELLGTTTDDDGKFILKPLPPGMYSVKVSFVGYEPLEILGVEVIADRATYLNKIELAGITLQTLQVTAKRSELIERPLISIDDPSRMSILAKEFKNDPNKRDPVKFMGATFAGVTPAPNGEGLYFRGSRTENMVSFIDGVKISGSVPRVPPSAISSISVYTGGLPAKYGDVTGGVVVIETKTYQEMYHMAQIEAFKQQMQEQQQEH
jgi:hypothetical protein